MVVRRDDIAAAPSSPSVLGRALTHRPTIAPTRTRIKSVVLIGRRVAVVGVGKRGHHPSDAKLHCGRVCAEAIGVELTVSGGGHVMVMGIGVGVGGGVGEMRHTAGRGRCRRECRCVMLWVVSTEASRSLLLLMMGVHIGVRGMMLLFGAMMMMIWLVLLILMQHVVRR